jgi:N6-L-threonylcarbamoyladenine synthase
VAVRLGVIHLRLFDQPVLGIETSCDETSAAVIVGDRVLSNVVSSQADLHRKWGGVVPEAAARRHAEALLPAVEESLAVAGMGLGEVGGVAVTNRPGLIGALAVGVAFAKGLAASRGLPLVGVHHLEAHVLSPFLAGDVPLPHVCLLVSGGHTELILVRAPGEYEVLGGTIDDAAGEAFDKAARSLGLGYPGGPAIQSAAETGDPARYSLPRGLSDPTLDFSFAGLKTAVRVLAESEAGALDVASAAASFEATVAAVLADRALLACRERDAKAVTLVGGVAANRRLRGVLSDRCEAIGVRFAPAPAELCTDNAAMIAFAGSWRLARGERDTVEMDTLSAAPLPNGGTQ